MPHLDATDHDILAFVQENGRAGPTEIAAAVGRSSSLVHDRLKRLERDGVVRRYEARVDPAALGATTVAFVHVTMTDQAAWAQAVEVMHGMPEVQEVHLTAGEECILVKVRVANPEALMDLLHGALAALPGVGGTRCTMVLKTTKETAAVAIPRRSRA